MNKPTIIYLLDTLQTGGAEKSLLAITSKFQYFKPIFVTLFDGRHDLLPDYEEAGIEVIRLGLPVSNRFRELAKYVDKIVIDQKAVIVHSSIFRSDMTARHLNSRVKIINSLVNNSYRKRRYDGLAWRGKISLLAVQLLDRFTIARIDLMIANSQVLVDSHKKTIGLNPRKTIVIHRGRPIPIQTKVLPSAHRPLPTAQWLCVGRLIERKGHKDLLPAFAELLKKRPLDRLILAGDGEYRGEVEKEIKRLGIDDSVDLLGTVTNISELLEKADFFVFPSYFEGLPGAIIEAMFANLSIICSDIPENKECLKEGMCLFHKVGDKKDLLAKMHEALILQDWQERTKRAFTYASEHFEIGEIAAKYEDVYSNLLLECVEF